MDTKDLKSRDYKYIIDKPDLDFSPKRNKLVIENSIKKYEAMRMAKIKTSFDGIRERSSAVADFLDHVNRGGHNDLDRYFGQSTLAKLRGLEIIDEMKSKLNMITAPSPVYVQGGMVKNVKGKIMGREISNVKKKQKRKAD